MTPNPKLSLPLSFGEEVANSVSHACAALSMLVLLPIASIHTFESKGSGAVVGTSIFVSSLFLMFLSSAIYHAMAYGSKHKYVLRIIDHSMIYLAIAGSYTPIILQLLNNWLGYSILAIQWISSLGGILYKIFARQVNERLSLLLYLVMGWLVVFILPPIIRQTGPAFWALMVAGGLSYSLGAVFYAKKRPYFHFIWHLFIILASLLQFIAIVYFM